MARGKTVDLGALSIQRSDEEVAAPKRGGGARPFTANPEINAGLQDTYHNGGSAVIPGVPEDGVGSAKSQVRRHAKELGISVQFQPVDNGDGTVNLKFAGQAKRNYKPRKSADEQETVDA